MAHNREEDTNPPIRISNSTWWKLDSRTVIGVVVLTGVVVSLYSKVTNDISKLKESSENTVEFRKTSDAKLDALQQKVNTMDGKLDALLLRK